MVHAYLGTALRYRRLGSLLRPDRPLVGIQVQEFEGPDRATRTSVQEMANEAVLQIRSHQPHGPYLVGGHSAGGLVAYEAARLLDAAGEEVSMVVLIDSPMPRSRLHYLWAEAVLNWPDVRSGDRLRRHRHVEALPLEPARRFRRRGTDDRVGSTITRSYRSSKEAVRDYHPGPYAGPITVMRTSQGATMALGRGDLGWKGVATGDVTCLEIPGLHTNIFESPRVEEVAARLDEVLERADVATTSAVPSGGIAAAGDPAPGYETTPAVTDSEVGQVLGASIDRLLARRPRVSGP
jgi:thioesterase domain-containing protein